MAHVSQRDPTPTAPAETQVALMRGLRGKNVLVTGGASGIGQAIVIRFGRKRGERRDQLPARPQEATETEA
jgi:NADPH:quinone reductase-like Zn-dependent oxidoreductase